MIANFPEGISASISPYDEWVAKSGLLHHGYVKALDPSAGLNTLQRWMDCYILYPVYKRTGASRRNVIKSGYVSFKKKLDINNNNNKTFI